MPVRTLPEVLLGDWWNVDTDALDLRHGCKYADRDKILRSSWNNLQNLIPGRLWPVKSGTMLDISCANGACLEIMRHFGYKVMGVDFYIPAQADYEAFLVSQDIPHVIHACRVLPLPFEDDYADIVLSIGAMTNYIPDGDDVVETWLAVLDEFARIASETIAISFNHGANLDIARDAVSNWKHPQFAKTLERGHLFRWDK